jgi:hypothetical protein
MYKLSQGTAQVRFQQGTAARTDHVRFHNGMIHCYSHDCAASDMKKGSEKGCLPKRPSQLSSKVGTIKAGIVQSRAPPGGALRDRQHFALLAQSAVRDRRVEWA